MKKNIELDSNLIFVFSSVHYWEDTRILSKEIKSLRSSGKNIDYYAIGPKRNDFNIEGVNVHLLKEGSKMDRPNRWLSLVTAALASEAKYYHFHDPELLYVAKKIRKHKPNAIIIYDMHEYFYGQLSTKEWIPSLIRKPVSKIAQFLEKRWMKNCNGVIFAENSYAQYFENFTGFKMNLLNYPIWVPKINVEKSSVFTLIYVGDITEDRNIFGMVEIVKLLKAKNNVPFQLKLIGSIHPTLKKKVLDKIIEYKLEEVIKWYGRLPYEQIWEHCFSANVGLCLLKPIPNYVDSMATKIFEYMAAEIPVIASDFPSWEKLINEHSCGFTSDPLNSENVVSIIEKIENSPVLAKQLGVNGREAYENNYSWKSEEKKLLSFYESLK